MRNMKRLSSGATLWLPTLIMCACVQGRARFDDTTESAIRELVGTQATSDMAVWASSSDQLVRPSDVVLQPGPEVSARLRVVRAMPPRDHWHPYLIGLSDGQTYRLGGFPAPELLRLAGWLADNASGQNVIALARMLSLLADEDGAVRSFFVSTPSDSSFAAISSAWQSIRPPNWPRDTVMETLAGGRSVRVTLLSQQSRSYDLGWRATAFDFQFDAQGRLKSWSRRVSDKFDHGSLNRVATPSQ